MIKVHMHFSRSQIGLLFGRGDNRLTPRKCSTCRNEFHCCHRHIATRQQTRAHRREDERRKMNRAFGEGNCVTQRFQPHPDHKTLVRVICFFWNGQRERTFFRASLAFPLCHRESRRGFFHLLHGSRLACISNKQGQHLCVSGTKE